MTVPDEAGVENCWCGYGLVIDDFASRCDGRFQTDSGQVIAGCKTPFAANRPIVKVTDDLVGIADGHILRSANQMARCVLFKVIKPPKYPL